MRCNSFKFIYLEFLILIFSIQVSLFSQFLPIVPDSARGRLDAQRTGLHDANNIRTLFYNMGMVGDYQTNPDLTSFHSVEIPNGKGVNYCDGTTPFVLAKIKQKNGKEAYIMETGYREREAVSPYLNRTMQFEPRPGYLQDNPAINKNRYIAMSNDPRTWPDEWPDKADDKYDPGWKGSWNGYFGKRPAADQESFFVMDDGYYDAWDFQPDSRDPTRKGLGLKVEVRGFQWANPLATNVIFWHYDITNEGTTDYDNNIIFGLYMDAGVGGSQMSCDGVYESDDDNAFYDKSLGLNLVYTWDKNGHGVGLNSNCEKTGYLGYAYLETPGNPWNGIDDDDDGIIDERRDSGPGELIVGQDNIMNYLKSHPEKYNISKFEAYYGPIKDRPAYRAGRWWTGDEDMDWIAELCDKGADGIGPDDLGYTGPDEGEGDGMPTSGEQNFDKTDLHESDQIGLTGFKMNRIVAGAGNPSTEVDQIVFYDDQKHWPKVLYEKFSDPDPANRYDVPVMLNYNIGFLFASGPFILKAGKKERFSLALAFGWDLYDLKKNVTVVQKIYNANYQYATPPKMPILKVESGDKYVRLMWDDLAERGIDPVTLVNDFEGYKIYRSTDYLFQDAKIITDARGSGKFAYGKPIVQFDKIDGVEDYSNMSIDGVKYYLGNESGITHTWTDSNVNNGQDYFYAVVAYDFGSDSLGFFPSENSIAVSKGLRGGIMLPDNVVEVRPNPKVTGYIPASTSDVKHSEGSGTGSVEIKVLNSSLVPNNHLYKLVFGNKTGESIRADYYDLIDSTTYKTIFNQGYDMDGLGIGQVGSGLLPIVHTPQLVEIDSSNTGFTSSSATNAKFSVQYQDLVLPKTIRRPGFPDNLFIYFYNDFVDTSLMYIGMLNPAKFKIMAQTSNGEMHMKFRFRDLDGDGLLSSPDEFIDVITYISSAPNTPKVTWRIMLDTVGQYKRGKLVLPKGGDIFKLITVIPLGKGDVFVFTTHGESVNKEKAKNDFKMDPYVIPNPYVGSASFEPERYATTGRGDRRIEFRGLPQKCTIRIYTIRGELVQTLYHDGSVNGFVPWDLRTKDNLDVAPGLYIFHVDSDIGTRIGKFAIIK
jgi:hypothetical protein